jgi:hypothetical protein
MEGFEKISLVLLLSFVAVNGINFIASDGRGVFVSPAGGIVINFRNLIVVGLLVAVIIIGLKERAARKAYRKVVPAGPRAIDRSL